jgi:hypothetical protein
MASRHLIRRHGLLLVAAFVAADAAVAVAACSTSSPESEGADATAEASAPDAAKDSPATQVDSAVDSGKVGNCSPAKGPCDIVLQNCPAQQECVVIGTATKCQPVQATQQLGVGRTCCPNGNGNPCLPGLSCIGSDCTDGGVPSARCAPACCTGDDQACGKSDPEGISGTCDLTIVDDMQTKLYNVCTYRQRCQPFKIEPCKPLETCLVEDKVGSASCVTSAGKTNRQPCSAGNDCADGFSCYPDGDAGVCHQVCLLPGSVHPFDASVEEGGPGMGGCPSGEKCLVQFSNRPSWFALCALPDGG